jgi:hypothetical protein
VCIKQKKRQYRSKGSCSVVTIITDRWRIIKISIFLEPEISSLRLEMSIRGHFSDPD